MIKKILITIALTIAFILSQAEVVYGSNKIFDTDNTFGIEPASASSLPDKLELHPGELYKGFFRVFNETDMKMTYTISIKPITFADTAIDTTNKTSESQIASWISIFNNIETISIDPYENAVVNYMIDIPADITAGEQ